MIHYVKKKAIPIQLQINSKNKNQETIKVTVVGEKNLKKLCGGINKDNIKVLITVTIIVITIVTITVIVILPIIIIIL